MSSVFSQIGQTVKGNPLASIFSGVGLLSNILGQRKQNQYIDSQLAYQKLLQKYSNDPTLLAKTAAGAKQPLTQGLVEGVGNEVQGYTAERGLSTSPQIQSEVMAQAIAPYIQHQQDVALQSVLDSLALPGQAHPPNFSGPMDLSSLMQMLLKPLPTRAAGGSGGASGGGVISEADDPLLNPSLGSDFPSDIVPIFGAG